MKVIDRYILSRVLIAVGVVFLAFSALFTFFEFVGELERVGVGERSTLFDAILLSVLRMPARGYEVIPISVLIGTLFAVAQLSKSSELNVLRTAGVSTRGLLFLLCKGAAVFALVTLCFGEFVAPWSEQLSQEIKRTGFRSAVKVRLESGYWLRDGQTYVNVQRVSADAGLSEVEIFQFDEHGRLQSTTLAESGHYLQPDLWRLESAVETLFLPDGSVETKKWPEKLWGSSLSPDILGVLNVLPERMSISTLWRYVRHLSENRQDPQRYVRALWKKIVYPLTAFVMVVLALPFGFSHGRSAGVGLKLFVGVMLGVVFYLLDGLSSSLGQINRWPPLLSAAMPSIMFAALAFGVLRWQDRR